MEIFVCSANRGKIKEIIDLLPPAFSVKSLDNGSVELPETGDTLEENAIQKARWGFDHSALPSIADDSGLEVDALNGAPGVHSARFAGPQRSDRDNMEKLLHEIGTISNRRARFRTVIAYCEGDSTQIFDGMINGHISGTPRGSAGFGYDPIFIPEGADRTFAEMSFQEKQRSSHRAIAMNKLIAYLIRRV